MLAAAGALPGMVAGAGLEPSDDCYRLKSRAAAPGRYGKLSSGHYEEVAVMTSARPVDAVSPMTVSLSTLICFA